MRRNKYNARRTKVDGITFDSRREAEYYLAYKADEKAGRIFDLKLQQRYELPINGEPLVIKSKRYSKGRKVTYWADFTFHDMRLGKEVAPLRVIDVKGFDTPLSKLKRALMKACHGIDVEVVR